METPERIEVNEGREVVLAWADGKVQTISAADLRASCLCATCREEAGAARIAQLMENPDQIRIAGAALVGAYAINFGFQPDDHSSGIFAYDTLRAMGNEPEEQD